MGREVVADGTSEVKGANDVQNDDVNIDELLDFLRGSRHFELEGYKRSTLTRAVQRRMRAVGQPDVAGYVGHLEVRSDEFAHLFDSILINVTGLFRDSIAWQVLSDHVVELLEAKGEDEPIRVWSAGCASGEEAFSLAILLAEIMGVENVMRRVKIYATDRDEGALAFARVASYTQRSTEQLSARLSATYFRPKGDGLLFHQGLRQVVTFGRHDLLKDPPISRVDILTCRNTLMYFDEGAQSRVLGNLHTALAKGGLFFLGKAEMLLGHTALFAPIDLKHRLFTRAVGPSRRVATVRAPPQGLPDVTSLGALYRAAFDDSASAQVVLDAESTVVLVNRPAEAMFSLFSQDVGRPFHELEMSSQPVELRSVIARVARDRRARSLRGVELFPGRGAASYFDIDVLPLEGGAGNLAGVHLLFRDSTLLRSTQARLRTAGLDLVAARGQLQSTREELETRNEELQSTIEELETANDELLAANQELGRINTELQDLNDERRPMDLRAVLQQMRSGVVVVDHDLSVELWNRAMEELSGVAAELAIGKSLLGLDIGLPLAQLRADLGDLGRGNAASRADRVMDCIDRRGKPIRCRVDLQPLNEGSFSGAIVIVDVMEEGTT